MEALSPLRYPGGKRNLIPTIEARAREHPTELFVEPFAGGASASLHLLSTDAVQRAVIADADPLVSAFWQVATTCPAELIEAISKEPVTLARWDFWRATEPESLLDKATKALFLNRTSFSGILHAGAGPLGGRAQAGKVKIDSRWYPATVARRIEAVGRLAAAGRLEAWGSDWPETLRRVGDRGPSTFVYLDPPYVCKGSRLYAWSFSEQDHRELAAYLTGPKAPARWLLSYDNEPLVRQLYEGQYLEEHELAYSAAARKSTTRKAELLIGPKATSHIVPRVNGDLPEVLLALARTAASPDALARQLEADDELQRQVWASQLGIQAAELASKRRPDSAPEVALGLVARAAFRLVGRPVPDLQLKPRHPKPAANRPPRVDEREGHGWGWRTSKRKEREMPMSEWDRFQAAEGGAQMLAQALDSLEHHLGWQVPALARQRLLTVAPVVLDTAIRHREESAHSPALRAQGAREKLNVAVERVCPGLSSAAVAAAAFLVLGPVPRGTGQSVGLLAAWKVGFDRLTGEEWRRSGKSWLRALATIANQPRSRAERALVAKRLAMGPPALRRSDGALALEMA